MPALLDRPAQSKRSIAHTDASNYVIEPDYPTRFTTPPGQIAASRQKSLAARLAQEREERAERMRLKEEQARKDRRARLKETVEKFKTLKRERDLKDDQSKIDNPVTTSRIVGLTPVILPSPSPAPSAVYDTTKTIVVARATQEISLAQAVAQLTQALDAHKNTAEYQAAILSIMENTSARATEIISPADIDLVKNQGITPVRAAIFSVFERTRRLLGRDSEASVVADTAEHLKKLRNRIDMSTAATGRGGYAASPFDWIAANISPVLDTDMRAYSSPKQNLITKKWFVVSAKPYLQLDTKLYTRLFHRSSRAN